MGEGITAIYCRRSKPNQHDVRDTVDSQEAELRAFAEQRGWTNVVVFKERGAPASAAADARQRRKVFHGELKPAVSRGEIDRVLVVEPSRVSRDMVTFLSFVQGVQTYFTRQGTDSISSDPLRLALDAGLAAQESKIRSDRQRSHRQRMREAGRPHSGGFRRYGYEPDGVTLRPKEVRLIRESARMIKRGDSLRAVTLLWKERGVRSERRDVPPEEWRDVTPMAIRRTLMYSDLLDQDTRDATRAIFEDPKRLRNAGGFNQRSYVLSGGYARCGRCGEKLVSQPRYDGSAPNKRRRTYACITRVSDGTTGCGETRVDADEVEGYVLTMVQDVIAYGSTAPSVTSRDEETATLEDERAALMARIERLEDDYVDGVLTADAVKRQRQRLDRKVREVKERIRESTRERIVKRRWDDVVALVNPTDLTDRAVFERWRALVETGIVHVKVTPRQRGGTRFDIRWTPEAAKAVKLAQADFEATAKHAGYGRRRRSAA